MRWVVATPWEPMQGHQAALQAGQDAASLRRGFLEGGGNTLTDLCLPSLDQRRGKAPKNPLASRPSAAPLAGRREGPSGCHPDPHPLPSCLPGVPFSAYNIKGEKNLLSSSRNCPGKKKNP